MIVNIINKKNLTILIAISSLIVSIVVGIQQCNLQKAINKLHVDVNLECFLVRSRNSNLLEFYVKNTSPIPAVSLSVFHKYYVFFRESAKYVSKYEAPSSILNPPGQFIYTELIEPNDFVSKKEPQMLSTLSSYKKKAIIAAIFEVVYYRESDMKEFKNRAIFFLDGEKIYSFKNALKVDFLKTAVEELAPFENRNKSLRQNLRSKGSGSKLYQKAE